MAELDAVIASTTIAARQVDLVRAWPKAGVSTLVGQLADRLDAVVAAEQGAGDLASLTTAIGLVTTAMRARVGEIETAVATHGSSS